MSCCCPGLRAASAAWLRDMPFAVALYDGHTNWHYGIGRSPEETAGAVGSVEAVHACPSARTETEGLTLVMKNNKQDPPLHSTTVRMNPHSDLNISQALLKTVPIRSTNSSS
ncbi:hypothetical protein AOLI_G00256110 [Acnodon oligacanthus]